MGFSQNVSYIFEGFTYPKCKLHFGEVPPAKKVGIFLMFRCGFAWQAQGIVHLFKSEQNVRVL